jgi:hypothetical protein
LVGISNKAAADTGQREMKAIISRMAKEVDRLRYFDFMGNNGAMVGCPVWETGVSDFNVSFYGNFTV